MTKAAKAILIAAVTVIGSLLCILCAEMLGTGLRMDDINMIVLAVFCVLFDVVSTVMLVYAIYTEEG